MKKWVLILAIPFLMVSCNAQTKSDKNIAENQKAKKEANVNEPKVDIKVNKVYDENGNLIGYDSTYVWSYTNVYGDSIVVNPDSVLYQFKPIIGSNFPGFFENYDQEFFGDSLFYHDFMAPDYFMDRWEKEMSRMSQMMREMDSLKELFFRQHYPALKKEKPKTKTL